jgi:DNA-binding IclR family transcriptional regulator
MRTVERALKLLDHFSAAQPELGLSALARLAGLDKATTHRMLTALARQGIVEQNPQTKLYRLGGGILRLARVREAAFPVSAIVVPVLERLTEETGETSHASLFSGGRLGTIGVVESAKSIRVSVEPGQPLPFHATASGLAFMAFGPERIAAEVLARRLESFTPATGTDPRKIERALEEVRRTGFAMSDQTFETDVFGIAAPLFDSSGIACGSIAVATPSHRMTSKLQQLIVTKVTAAAIETTRGMGADPPPSYPARNGRRAA